jgi:hypothetical protein
MRSMLVLLSLVALCPGARGEAVTADGILYFDRGHYWIEITLQGRIDALPPIAAALFEIVESNDSSFRPSRVEILEWTSGRGVLLLSSGRFKGGRCYRVLLKTGPSETLGTDPICDPFYHDPRETGCSSKRIFSRYVARAFGRSGEVYRLNRFSYDYEFGTDRSQSNLAVSPCFDLSGWGIEPSFEQRETVFEDGGAGEMPVSTRALGMGVSKSTWAGDLGLKLACSYRHERSLLHEVGGDSVIYAHSAKVGATVRLDNLFDGINRYCVSVFKGIDLGFGYAWYLSNDEEVWGEEELESTTPFMIVRATWTLFYGFQFSYALESYWPSTLNDRFEEFQSVRVRLLLRDVLEKERRKPYHPDLEFSFDEGKRLPLFQREKRISVGFTFDLFPW